MSQNWLVIPIISVAALGLIYFGRRLNRPDRSVLELHLRYQPLALGIALVAVLMTRGLIAESPDFFMWGTWSASASDLGWLGVVDGDSWLGIGLTFLPIMATVTAVTLWLQVGRGSGATGSMVVFAFPIALGLSITNALSEELIFRLCITEALSPVASMTVISLISAVIFGLPHWFGNPGKIPGVVLAGFMGWFLALSVMQTQGLGWAVAIHWAQDVVIFTVLIAAGKAAKTAR